MTDDPISRQAAIDLLKDWSGGYNYIEIETEAAIKYFQQLPSAPPEQLWTPCSERFPIGQEEVIVSCHDDSGDTPFDYTSCGWVTTDGKYWIVDNEINNHVIAWMPLPEPLRLDGE